MSEEVVRSLYDSTDRATCADQTLTRADGAAIDARRDVCSTRPIDAERVLRNMRGVESCRAAAGPRGGLHRGFDAFSATQEGSGARAERGRGGFGHAAARKEAPQAVSADEAGAGRTPPRPRQAGDSRFEPTDAGARTNPRRADSRPIPIREKAEPTVANCLTRTRCLKNEKPRDPLVERHRLAVVMLAAGVGRSYARCSRALVAACSNSTHLRRAGSRAATAVGPHAGLLLFGLGFLFASEGIRVGHGPLLCALGVLLLLSAMFRCELYRKPENPRRISARRSRASSTSHCPACSSVFRPSPPRVGFAHHGRQCAHRVANDVLPICRHDPRRHKLFERLSPKKSWEVSSGAGRCRAAGLGAPVARCLLRAWAGRRLVAP